MNTANVVENNLEKEKCNDEFIGLVLFSGGFDSVAVLHKLIVSDKFSSINVLFENCFSFPEGEAGTLKAKKSFSVLKKIAKKHECEIFWTEETINVDNINYSVGGGADILLFYHLTTAIRHGENNNVYLGWNREHMPQDGISAQLLNWYNTNKNDKYNIFFLDDVFDAYNETLRKVEVIKYLLENNLFGLPYSACQWQSIKEYESRTTWFRHEDEKECEVATAVVGTCWFSSEELVKIFAMKNTSEIQNYHNQKVKSILKSKEIF